jgi:hypothetical protein
MATMLRLLRLLVLVLLAPLAFSLVYEAYRYIRSSIQLQDVVWFLLGFGFYVVLYVPLLAEKLRFLEVLEHEMGHTAVSLAFLKVPESMKAHYIKGGEVGPVRGDFLAHLAPYYLPVLTIPLLLIRPLVSVTLGKALDFLIGFSLAFHYSALFARELRFNQPDLCRMGRIFSVVVILVFNVVWLVITLAVMTGDYSGLLTYFKKSLARTSALYTALWQAWQARELPPIKDLIEQSNPS